MRRWARTATAGVSVLAGVLVAAVPHWLDAVGEADDGHPSTLATALGIALIAAGVLTAFVAGGYYLVIGILVVLFAVAFWGDVADDTYYGGVAGITLVLIGLLSLVGRRGARGRPAARGASAGAGASPGARSEAPSRRGEGPDDRAPRS